MDEHTMLKRAEQILKQPSPLREDQLAFLELVADQISKQKTVDSLASQGVGGLLGGAAATALFGPLAILPILAGIACGVAFGNQTHKEAFRRKEELYARIVERLLREQQ